MSSVALARHICDTYYTTTLNPIVQHHIDSYDDLVERRIPLFIQASNPAVNLVLGEGRAVRVYLGGKDGTKIGYRPPLDEVENAVVPNICRCENRTYALDCIVDVDIEYQLDDKTVETAKFEKVLIGQIPLMLRSKFCHLTSMNLTELGEQGEDYHELGGYFVIGGSERVLLTQERLGNNLYYAGSRKVTSTQEEEQVGGKTTESEETMEFYAGIRSVSEDGTRGPYSHYLIIPAGKREMSLEEMDKRKATNYGASRIRGMPIITLPGFKIPVPVLSVLHLLGINSDKDLYDTIFVGVPFDERTVYDDLFLQLILGHKVDSDLDTLRVATKSRSNEEVFYNLQVMLLPHVEGANVAELYRSKAYTLGYLLRLAVENVLGIRKNTDRDHFQFKRFDVSGDLCFQEFKRIYKEVGKEMKLKMDTRIHFEEKIYRGRGLTTLIQRENIGHYWKSYMLLSEFSKSFKGKWGGRDGVSQILSRLSMLGTVSQLRRSALQMDDSVKALGARRLHGSSFGFTCPADVPDGRSVGFTKHLSLLTSVSTQSDSAPIKKLIRDFPTFYPTASIHPSAWDSAWTRIMLNGDIYGAVARDTPGLYNQLIDYRREQAGMISVAWNRTDNVLTVWSDQGRPVRPLYRAGVKPADILSKTTWKDLAQFFDFVDADESDTIRVSMEPLSPTLPSEIHGVFMLSPLSAVIPFSNHNPGPRVAFSCAQSRQGASWYHSNFNKRFDTITLIINTPQRPICETWMYPHVLGRGGCMPYGDNAIVAISSYSGYNQEDSVILNAGALHRGLFGTTYFHSYTIAETMTDYVQKTHTEIANPLQRGMKPKEGKDYSKLDANGIIRVGSEVDENTILVGVVTKTSDVSETPKRGQRGVVDGIQMFTANTIREGDVTITLTGVKIRVAEARGPTLGDKFSSRAGQKGTVGMIMGESDMPFTSKGLRPDLILNPHAIPSRMTTGQMLETMSARIGTNLGTLIDATPFCTQNPADEYRSTLLKLGFEPNASEWMYNGMTGEMMEMEIFIGPVYYICSKLMVEDKINYRDTGSRTLLTHQPLQGRSAGGGMRIGEMERDALVAHGVSSFIEESFMKRSDEHEVIYQPETGLLDSTGNGPVENLRMPYAMSLFVKEMESMHISVSIKNESP